ncbi:uncharacterized protein LOC115671511 [Syzygium oleosum]|uniref:uncharacterized protein LOC115671511 n=1 Tax=Syzygium oleosum TaxID=219896 RepID=UPI0011D2BD26|nr:uncharacterized protein LOC115671511 [Syzygium oleosum]XP_056174673.1 uncharacterized protein LOC115671511 [Syzygium oleosum]XP_056174674.1 uncharacterized protein LOC115671511 [Syzygium oleosum]XP_056174675.1 uncharacterized protein LOC115671511 [Syzygium oleosum]
MQLQQSSRIDLVDLKAQIVKRLGVERSKLYFYHLDRFLSQKLNKVEFDKLCCRVLGRENLSLHNQLIRSILKNAFQAKIPPPSISPDPKSSLRREDGHEQSLSVIPNQNPNVSVWSNGVLPLSPRKVRSGIRDRKFKDRPSPLGPNGKVDCLSHSAGIEESGRKVVRENGELTPRDYQRPLQHIRSVTRPPEDETEGSIQQPINKYRVHGKDQTLVPVLEEREDVEQVHILDSARNPLVAPLGIPFCSPSIGGGTRSFPVGSNGDYASCYDYGQLFDSETLKKRIEQIAAGQGIGGVSQDCANILNSSLDVYLKQLIRSCVELVGARSGNPKGHPLQKLQVPGRVSMGMSQSKNHLATRGSSSVVGGMQEESSPSSISLLDFKTAMELNPQQLGEDWPLLLEKISMRSYEE